MPPARMSAAGIHARRGGLGLAGLGVAAYRARELRGCAASSRGRRNRPQCCGSAETRPQKAAQRRVKQSKPGRLPSMRSVRLEGWNAERGVNRV